MSKKTLLGLTTSNPVARNGWQPNYSSSQMPKHYVLGKYFE